MKDDVEKGAVDVQVTVVLNKAQLPKLIEKETDARPRGADHFGQRFLTDLRNERSPVVCLCRNAPTVRAPWPVFSRLN